MLEALSTGQPGDSYRTPQLQHLCHVFVTFPHSIPALAVGHGPLFPARVPQLSLRVDTGGTGATVMPGAPVAVGGGLTGRNSGCAEKMQDSFSRKINKRA